MSTDKVVVILVVSIVGAAVCAWQLRRALREPVDAEVQHDVGADSLRLLEELDAHLDAHFAKLAGLYERLGPPPGPDPMAAGLDRLRGAIRDEQAEAS